jgi:N-methylhydantoinase A/oxoprolinase/acetone carboxylase beta subunit
MAIALGIDTGGTYTDAVVVDQDGGEVLSAAKSLTTYYDLSVGIGRAVAGALEALPISARGVDLVALSTTLATNAIVEGVGSPVCLLLIGYDAKLIQQYGFEHQLVTDDVVYLRGGHDVAGNEAQPLDEAAAREAILARRDTVEAFAVSGYFSVRNPAHELRVRALVQELTVPNKGRGTSPHQLQVQPLPVTCGHELTSRLNSVRRATTAALNARLIPLLRELMATLRHTLADQGVVAPLMVVKGDGSLVRAEWAMQRPIETILSGPAASVVGGWHLASQSQPAGPNHRDVWVVDVGGTTTDIASLREGRPRLNPEGAQVGMWRTMVEAVDVQTVGLGGDSQVGLTYDHPTASLNSASFDPQGGSHPSSRWLTIGPRRVVPLCLLASEHPQVVKELQRQVAAEERDPLAGQFVVAQRRPTRALQNVEEAILRQLADGPRSLLSLVNQLDYGTLVLRYIRGLVAERLVLRAGFTPTDALHVLARFEHWSTEPSQLGAELLARGADLSPQTFCKQVVAGVSDLVAKALVSKVLSDETVQPEWEREPSAMAMLARALDQVPDSDLECRLTLRRPVVAIGAPVEAYMPRLACQLRTQLVIPPHADVANAVGAVAGGVVQRLQVIIRPIGFAQAFRLHLTGGVQDFSTVEAGVTYAQQVVPPRLEEQARQAGADQVVVRMVRRDREAPSAMGELVYLGTDLDFTAVGRPSLRSEYAQADQSMQR